MTLLRQGFGGQALSIGPGIVPLSAALRAEIEASGVTPALTDWIHKLEATPPGGLLVYWDSAASIHEQGDGLLGFFMRLQMMRAVALFQRRGPSGHLAYVALRRDGWVEPEGGARPRVAMPPAMPDLAASHKGRKPLEHFTRRRSSAGALSSR
ncbi:hypothetical protein FRZ44_38250 [Hypericibacter terrae]|uniref:Uncharacterized protein n=1 Tax=Hypericibacter terrae TaxID=2602015 RepID=A0A5J6MLS3_9PROT|nr:hypothetical protein [Hypericibacter terrae]QEX18518.1 hypothetical protein FRZ44_38250 [Hypericibacter terrae]